MHVYIALVFSSFIFSLIELFTTLRQKKWFKGVQFSFITTLFILYAFNRGNNDYENYQKMFMGEMYVADKGYILLTYFIKLCGGTYNVVPFLLGCFLILIIFYLYKTNYTISFLFFYSIVSFMFDVNQIRNLFCSLFLLIGIFHLKKKKRWVYFIFNTLASLFQRLGIVYFLFFILNEFKLRTYKNILLLIFLVELSIIKIFPYFFNIFFPDKLGYFDKQTHFSPLAYFLYLFINLIIIKLGENKKMKTCEEIYIKIMLFPIIFLPTSLYFLEILTRIVRFSNYVKWFYFFKYIKQRRKMNVSFIIFVLLLFQEVMLWAIGTHSNPDGRLQIMKSLSNVGFYF